SGSCVHEIVSVATSCDDSDACTTGDTCNLVSGVCEGVPVVCNNSDVCTVSSCVAGICEYSPHTQSNVACDDSDACTLNDVCSTLVAGLCQGTPMVCDD